MIKENKALIRRILYWSSVVLYLLSLIPPTYCTTDNCNETGSGIILLLTGVFAVASPGGFAWFANIFYLIALLLRKREAKLSLVMAIIAFLLSASFLFTDSIILNESGQLGKITAYKAGYWLWLSSMFTTAIASFYNFKIAKSKSLSSHN